MTSHKKRRPLFALSLLPALVFACAAARTAAAAEPATIVVNAEQEKISGIATAPITATRAGDPMGEGLRLPGVAAFPNKAVQLVSAPAGGVVEQVLVDPMEQVAAGAPLVVLRSPQILAWQREYVQASLQASLAAARLKRDQTLFDEGIVAESRLQESRSAWAHSNAAQRELRQTLQIAGMSERALAALTASHALSPMLSVAAPQRGIVIEQLASIGQRVEAGTPLAKIAQQDKLWIELQATRPQATMIHTGDAVQVDACSQPGKVAAIDSQLNAASQTVAIRVELPGAASCVRPNQHVEGIVKARSDGAAWLVNAGALVGSGGKDYLFVRTDKGFKAVAVQVAARDAATAAVRGPLQAGDQVAVRGVATLKGMWLGLGAEGK